MKSHAYLREKLLYGLRVQQGGSGAPRRAGSKQKPAVAEDASGSNPTPDASSLPPLVYQKYADFIPSFAAATGTTVADLNQPHVDIQDTQVLHPAVRCCHCLLTCVVVHVLYRRWSWVDSSTFCLHPRWCIETHTHAVETKYASARLCTVCLSRSVYRKRTPPPHFCVRVQHERSLV